jgi:hypothetical protein
MFDLVYDWQQQNNANRTEGITGVKNLCRLVRAMGHRDPLYNGQFAHDGAYGDLTVFLEDNPGAVQAIIDWITTEGDTIDEWKDSLASELPPEDDDEDEGEE